MQTTKLTEYLIEPFLVEQVKAKKVVGVYSGRFQPFGPHHKKTYEWLKKKFGNAYIVTSDIKGGSRHPMNFKEKKRHMMKMGIPSNRIIKVKNPYVAKELTEKLSEDTAVVFAFGAKDAGRLASGKYFQDYKKNKNNLVGYEEHGYVLVAPHISMRVGGMEVSGTSMRELLGHPKYEGGGERKKLFKKMFGYFDQGVFNMLTNKFRKLYEKLDISVREFEGDKIGDFLTTIDMKELIKESSTSVNFEVDDGPPIHYRGFSDYKRVTKAWIDDMYKGLGWKVVHYILSKGAVDPDFDYTMKYSVVPAVAYGRSHSGKYGERFGVKEPIKKYQERLNGVLSTLGWEVVKWMGLKDDFSGVSGVEVEAPVAPGIDGEDSNTQRAERDKLTGSKLHSIEEMIDLSDYISLISGNKIKEDVKYGGKYNEVGFIEDIEIKGIGKLKAKFDTGSEVYSALHAENIKQSNGMVEFDINGKHLKKKIIRKQKVDVGSKNIEDRVVVEFPMKLGKKTYPSVRFSLANRSANETEVLMSRDFIDKYDFVVNVNEEDIKPDIIKSFVIRDTLNTKLWDGDKLKPEIKKKLLAIGKNFFEDLELEPNVKLQDITLTGSISNYNWSKFSDVDLHLRIDFSQVDDDENFVQNYVLAKKTIWNNKHDIKIYGFPVEVYVENVGESHVASGLYSILKDEWIVIPKKKELQIDLDDIRSKAEGYLGSIPVLQQKMKDGKYDEVVEMVEKIQEKLKRMRSSGLERGGEFSVENLAFKALRRSPFISDIIQMKNDAYDKKMSMKERINLDDEVRLLVEGGAYGHMNHPFDDKDLTFGDLRTIIDLGLQGNLDREEAVTEKTDGQNLMITWKNGKLLAARNKGQIKSKGKRAMSAAGVARKFSGRGEIKKAFVFAMKDLEKAVGKLTDKQRKKIFDEGSNFMNLEIIYPTTANVIDYDKTVLQFHGAIKYDDSGTATGTVPGSGRILQGMIKQVNQHIQKHFKIEKPVFLKVPKNQDFSSKRSSYFSQLDKLKKQYALKDTDTLSIYHQRYWEEYIYNAAQQYGYSISNKILINLTKRWAFGDKSYKIQQIKNDIDNEKFLDWVLSSDKVDVEKKQKENMKPFEILFFSLGADILKNIDGFLAASPKKAVQKIRKDVSKAIKDVRKGGDLKKLNRLKQQLSKLNAIGGLDAVVPSEGIVFKYNGKTFKLTGSFAPINQITGLMTF